MGSVSHRLRLCRRKLHEIPAHKPYCPACHKTHADQNRLNARLAGKDADRQREWYAARYQTPAFRERELQRFRAYKQRPEVRMARRLGISVHTARTIIEDTS